jgi:hypothetical protein
MMKFSTYKIGPSPTGGWFWQVTQEVGPAALVVARSGHAFITEKGAMDSYKAFIKWAAGTGSAPPPTEPNA